MCRGGPVARGGAGASFALLLAAQAGCGPSEGSVLLRFPNQVARTSLARLQVEVFDTASGLASDRDRRCEDLLGTAAAGVSTLGVSQRALFACEPDASGRCPVGWFERISPLTIARGRSMIYVRGFADLDPDATAFLEGCTARFDGTGGGDGAEDVELPLSVVLPSSARLVLVGSNRRVGRPGEAVSTALTVRVEADEPRFGRVTYPIPGVEVRFEATGGAQIAGTGVSATVVTGLDGGASVDAEMPSQPGRSVVLAQAQALGSEDPARAEVRFTLSAVSPPQMSGRSFRLADIGRPVGLIMAPLRPGAPLSLAVLGCDGENEASCAPGVAARPPFGRARLAVLDQLDPPVRVEDVPIDLGILPAGIAARGQQLVMVASRREACQTRVCDAPETCPCWTQQSGTPCPCEGSEMLVLEREADRIAVVARRTLTASNAVALTVYDEGIAIAGQGRARNERPCSTVSQCLPSDLSDPDILMNPQNWGCPPAEACQTSALDVSGRVGVCAALDSIVDIVVELGGQFYNSNNCQTLTISCGMTPASRKCECGGAGPANLRNLCNARDRCGCSVPSRLLVGSWNGTVRPFSIASGRMSATLANDGFVVGSQAGLERYPSGSGRQQDRPLVNLPVERVLLSNFDPGEEQRLGGARVDDTAWTAPGACTRGVNYEEQCPIAAELVEAQGCFGLLLSDAIGELSPRRGGARCRRTELPARPIDLCAGDFDGDGSADIALTARDEVGVRLYLGDGLGGLLEPPVEVPLPPGAGPGWLACGDVDGDGRDEIVVASPDGTISLLRSLP